MAGGGRVGGSQRLGNVNTEYTEHWDTGADNIPHTTQNAAQGLFINDVINQDYFCVFHEIFVVLTVNKF